MAAYPPETTEAFCDGHVRAFAFLGGVPKSILYDNSKIAVARILRDGERRRARMKSATATTAHRGATMIACALARRQTPVTWLGGLIARSTRANPPSVPANDRRPMPPP
jgi:transposase